MAVNSEPVLYPLHTAASCGQVEEVKKLIKSKQFHVDSLNSSKQTPLHLTCLNGHLDLVDMLVSEFDADTGALDEDGNSPLLLAAYNGHIQIVFFLILIKLYGRKTNVGRLPVKTDPCISVKDGDHQLLESHVLRYHNDPMAKEQTVNLLLTRFRDVIKTGGEMDFLPLFLAASLGLEGVMSKLLVNVTDICNFKGSNGLTLLHAACIGGHTSLLSEYNLDPKAVDNYRNTPLHFAVWYGHQDTVRLLANICRETLISRNNQNNTPLNVAAKYGKTNVVHLLINEFGCDPSIQGYKSRTLLHQASSGGYIEVAESFISKYNLDPKAVDDNNYTPLHLAAWFGHQDTVRLLASICRETLISRNDQNNTPLHLAALNGKANVVHVLISEFGCDPSVKGFEGRTLLHQASVGGRTELAESFISKYNLDPKAVDDDNYTPLHLAAWYGHQDTVRLLANISRETFISRKDRNNTPLHVAALYGKTNVVHLLINEFGCDPSIQGYKGRTLLHQASSGGYTELAESFNSKYNLDSKAVDDDNYTPLHLAAWFGHQDTVRLLANICRETLISRNNQNNTPLHLAASNGKTNVVHLLINEFGCDPSIIGYKGRTLLHQASDGDHTELAESFISKYNLDPEAVDDNNYTPLHLAAWFGHQDTVRLLASICRETLISRNNQNNTPLHLAALNGKTNVVHLLINEFGCDPSIIGYKGRTLLHQASAGGHTELAESFISKYNLDPKAVDDVNYTPLHLAAQCGHQDTVRLLASICRETLTSRTSRNDTPLHLAALNGKTNVIHILINEFGCDPSIRGYKGRTLLHQVSRGGHTELTESFISKYTLDPKAVDDDNCTPLHLAAGSGHQDTVCLLANIGRETLISRNNQNDTPLHLAALYGETNVVHMLINEFGCDPSIKGFKGRTLLHQASAGDHTELTESFISKYTLDPKAVDDDNCTPLHLAAGSGHQDAVCLLANIGRETLISRSNQNDTPLHLAALNGKTNVVHMLINEFVCDTNIKGFQGRTLLHQACTGGHTELVEYLISTYNLSHFSADDDGLTPLHCSVIAGQLKCLHQLLYKHKAPLFIRTKSGHTAYDLAKQSSQSQQMLPIFIKYRQEFGTVIQAEYEEMYQLSRQQYNSKKHLATLFVVGHPEAGKSTLIESMKKEGYLRKLMYYATSKYSSVPCHTAGIIPSIHDSNSSERLQFYDFAGDPEYYSSHAAILENLKTSEGTNIFFVVCDLSEADIVIKEKYSYWLSFIRHNSSTSPPVIIPIGSHVDMLGQLPVPTPPTVGHKLSVIDNVSQSFSSSKGLDIDASIAVDCRNPNRGINDLKDKVREISHKKSHVELSLEASSLLGLLLKDFGNVTAIRCQQLISHIKDTGIPLSNNPTILYSTLKQLQALGILLIIQKDGDPIENHLLILSVSSLTSEVHKTLFSKSAQEKLSSLTESLQLSVGIIPEALLTRILPEYITKECLIQLQYCQEIENVSVERDHTLTPSIDAQQGSEDTPSTSKTLLFFPAFCQLNRENVSMAKVPNNGYALGLYVKCDRDGFDYFPTRFLHVLTIRLALNFALLQCLPTSKDNLVKKGDSVLTELHRTNPRCHVWSTGLHWLMDNGVEMFVDMPKEAEKKDLILIARSEDDRAIECASTFQKVIQTITEAKAEFCQDITPSMYFLNPDQLKDQSLPDVRSLDLFDKKEVEGALGDSNKHVVSVDGNTFLSSKRLSNLSQSTYWNLLFPIDIESVLNAITEVVKEWRPLGRKLGIHEEILEAINCDKHTINDKKTSMIQKWVSSRPLWTSLVQCLVAVGMRNKATQISKQHNVPLQEKLLDPNNSSVHPDLEFLHSFAVIVSHHWKCMASLLSLTSEEIESIKRETHGAGHTQQALLMLKKWVTTDTATYGLLCERLQTLSVFNF